MIKTEKQKTQKGVSTIGNLNLKIMNIVQNEPSFKITSVNQKKVDVSARENHKELRNRKTLSLKLELRSRSEKHNVFTEEVNKTALSANHDKGIQSIHLIKLNLNNKTMQKVLTIILLRKKLQKNAIQIAHIFLNTHVGQ